MAKSTNVFVCSQCGNESTNGLENALRVIAGILVMKKKM